MKKVLLAAVAVAVFQIPSIAAMSVDQTTDPVVLRNSGYSAQTTDMVSIGKARANGQEYYTADETAFKNQSNFAKFWRKLYVYTDPASEDYSFYHHDTDTVPTYTDL